MVVLFNVFGSLLAHLRLLRGAITSCDDGLLANQCLGSINMRSFVSSPLVVVGQSPKLTRYRSVGHGFGSAEQSLCCFQVFLASL
jgi:hypothetical protein